MKCSLIETILTVGKITTIICLRYSEFNGAWHEKRQANPHFQNDKHVREW